MHEELAEFDYEDRLDQVSLIVDHIQKSAASGNGPIFVADQQALDEKFLTAFYLDGYGNVVRHSAMDPEELGDMKSRQEIGRVVDRWSNGKVGPLYKRPGGLGTRYFTQGEQVYRCVSVAKQCVCFYRMINEG